MAARGVDPARVAVVYNWADEAVAKPVPRDPALAARLGMEGHFNVVYAGNMGASQGLDTVLDAAKQLRAASPDARLYLVGGGIEEARLKARAMDEGLGNVRFLPHCGPSEVAALMACAQAALVHLKDAPMFDIWIPSKTQSCLATGKPILLGVRGDAADLVRDAGAGVAFEPSSPDGLVEAVIQMVSMPPDELAAMGARGRDYYRRHLAFDVACGRMAGVIDEMVDGAPPLPATNDGVCGQDA